MKTQLRDFTQHRYYRVFRNTEADKRTPLIDRDCSFQRRVALYFKNACEMEQPIIFPDDVIAFTRTTEHIPDAYSLTNIEREFNTHDHNMDYRPISNVCPDYSIILCEGLDGIKARIDKELMGGCTNREKDFLESCLIVIDAIEDLSERYANEAERIGNDRIADMLRRVPKYPATTFLEALQSIRIMSSMLYLCGNYQLGFGRADQYLLPYFDADLNRGVSEDELFEYIESFFVALNRDTDLYFGVQQGDNGQSIMLGGVDRLGNSAVNRLTYLFMEASRRLCLIDPKINLRIDSNTPDDLLLLGSELTKKGLGFPQYSNDEVVIPALVNAGYDIEDARDYTVAACWEFIIPGYGLDIVNQSAVSFPYAVDHAIRSADISRISVDSFEKRIKEEINSQVVNILKHRNTCYLPSPLASILFHGPIEQHKDITECAKYRNRGIHGAGSANAADAMYVIEHLLDQDKEQLRKCLDASVSDYEDDEDLPNKLRNDYAKVGNADQTVDLLMKRLFSWFADACEKHSSKGCRVRAGSGSAQFYVLLTKDMFDGRQIEPIVGATLDGRRAGEPFSSSLAPASGVKVGGLLSVLKSFSVIDYNRIMNGGPITVELTDSVFMADDGVNKLKDVIRYFVRLGDQQLQLNVLNEEELEDAMVHPDRHRNLIVRVWGWSGYFCELDPEYQRQIINRHKYGL